MSFTTLTDKAGLMLVDRNTNMDSEQGLSLPTNFTLTPAVPAADLSRLLDDTDP